MEQKHFLSQSAIFLTPSQILKFVPVWEKIKSNNNRTVIRLYITNYDFTNRIKLLISHTDFFLFSVICFSLNYIVVLYCRKPIYIEYFDESAVLRDVLVETIKNDDNWTLNIVTIMEAAVDIDGNILIELETDIETIKINIPDIPKLKDGEIIVNTQLNVSHVIIYFKILIYQNNYIDILFFRIMLIYGGQMVMVVKNYIN